jgi:Carboxypeptidase regulatory-like domain
MRAILGGVIFSFALIAQQSGDYSISGTVVDSETGEPVRYALVTLTEFHERGDPVPAPAKKDVQAGGAGEFHFNGLAAANYSLTAQKPGFAFWFATGAPRSENIDLKASLSGVQLKLAPLGVIEGRVVDHDGEPLRGVNVIALQVRIQDGRKYTNSVRTMATDDRGMFRMWNLDQGKYFLKAAGKSGGTYKYVGEGTPYYSSWQSFAPVYFGGGKTMDAAQAIEIGAGVHASADFALTMEPAFKIRGALGSAPGGTVTFELVQGSGDATASRTSLNSSSGKFEVQDVTPGAYTLRVTEDDKLRGEARVVVGDGDVNGVSISLAPAVTVDVSQQILGAPVTDQVPGLAARIGPVRRTLCTVSLETQEANVAPLRRAKFAQPLESQPGVTAINDVLPGAYSVRVQCHAGYATSVMAGGTDLLENPNLVIQPGAAPPRIEVQVKPGGGALLSKLDVQPFPNTAELLLVPAAFARATGPLIIPIGEQPSMGWGSIAPGDYVAYAVADPEQLEYRNPAVVEKLTGGVSVHIEDGKETQVTISSISK